MSNSRRTIVISFSGIDGAGKSTQISHLQASLQDMRIVKLLTFWDDVATLKHIRENAGHTIFSGDKGVGTPEAPIQRADKNIQSPWMTCIRLAMYFLDAISLRRKVGAALHFEADVIIFDRYIYDELANLNLENAIMRLYARAMLRLVPAPEVSFVLDADPEQARARKPEYPLEFLHSNRDSYLRLARLHGGITVISPMPIEEAKTEVMRYVLCKLSSRDTENDEAEKHLELQELSDASRLNRGSYQ